MIDLALVYEEGPMLMKNISENQGISLKYLHALLTRLKEAGLVRSVRGAGGGFQLARHPSKIRIIEVVEALEGPLTPVGCVKDESVCERAEHCVARDVWRDLGDAMESTLSGLTLSELIDRKKNEDT